MFAGLLDRLNDVQTIKVTGGGQTLTMTRTADGKWQLAERGGYPADYKKARELALGLASLQLVEAKTAKADRLARLELGDPAKPDAKSHQVDLLDKDGKTLATAIVGKTKYGLYGGGRSGVYVRRGGEDQAWLAAGELSVPSSPTDVVSRDIIDIPQDEIGRVTLGPTARPRSWPPRRTATRRAMPWSRLRPRAGRPTRRRSTAWPGRSPA